MFSSKNELIVFVLRSITPNTFFTKVSYLFSTYITSLDNPTYIYNFLKVVVLLFLFLAIKFNSFTVVSDKFLILISIIHLTKKLKTKPDPKSLFLNARA